MRALDICDFTVIKTVNIYPSYLLHANQWASQVVLVVENLPANAGDIRDSGLIPGLGRSPGGRKGSPVQYSCLGNLMDRGAWWAIVHSNAERVGYD